MVVGEIRDVHTTKYHEGRKPNWREAFNQLLAGGGEVSGNCRTCSFCIILGVENTLLTDKCRACPFYCKVVWAFTAPCWEVFCERMDNSDRRAICRHVLSTVKDFTNVSEIRDRIAEMLDDDAREKFLGKAELEYRGETMSGAAYTNNGYLKTTDTYPEMPHTIIAMGENSYARIAAFRDEDTRDRVLEFLNER